MLSAILYVVFWIICILLIGIVLIQEGRGGGLGQSFGGAGGELFGHGAGGVNKATFVLAGLLVAVSFGIAKMSA